MALRGFFGGAGGVRIFHKKMKVYREQREEGPYDFGMQLKIQIPRLILAVAFAGILLGCGGDSKEGGTDQNQSSDDNLDNSLNNAINIGHALKSYMEKNFSMPKADEWCDTVLGDVGTLPVFYSPQHPDYAKLKNSLAKSAAGESESPSPDSPLTPGKAAKPEPFPESERISHYALNKGFDLNKAINEGKSVGSKVMVFECDLGWNGAGGLEDALKYMDKFKLERIPVVTANGLFRCVTRDLLKELEW